MRTLAYLVLFVPAAILIGAAFVGMARDLGLRMALGILGVVVTYIGLFAWAMAVLT